MTQTILKNFHRPIGLPAFLTDMGWMRNGKERTIEYDIVFDSSCAYDLGTEDQADWNKLFGVSFGLLGIHRHSLRFGWRYSTSKNTIEICAIVYDGETIKRDYLNCDVMAGDLTRFSLRLIRTTDGRVYGIFKAFDDKDRLLCGYVHQMAESPRLRFGAGFYFGGNRRAPHKMSISKERSR